MTLRELYSTPWSCITNYPRVSYPFRARVIARVVFANDYGVQTEANVLCNRTRTRYWLEIKSQGWLSLYLTTTSQKKAEVWLQAVRAGWSQVARAA